MKIVYCTNTLSSVGGIETVTITKANCLARNPCNSVWIITCCDDSLRTCIPLSENVRIIGIKTVLSWGFPWNLIQHFFRRRALRNKLGVILAEIHPDIVVSTGGYEKWIVPTIKGDWSTVRELHSIINVRKWSYKSLPGQLLSKFAGFIEYGFNITKYDQVVVLTQEEKTTNWNGNEKVCIIPNPSRFNKKKGVSSLDNKSIIAIGRLTFSKNFSSLIHVFSRVVKQFPDWVLDIYGDGEERENLLAEMDSLGLSTSVHLMGKCTNVQDTMLEYSVLACSSFYEGFGMVLIEAMSCGLPVVSYDCPCGPKDIIRDGKNGFLVPVGDEEAMADRICRLIEDESLRKMMGASAFERSTDYSTERICQMWEALFHKLRQKS